MNSAAVDQPAALSWWKVGGLCAGALYSPFVIMAIGTTLWVSCRHCKQVAWELLPLGPGVVPGMLLLSPFRSSLPGAAMWVAMIVINLLLLAGRLANLIRRTRWRFPILTSAFVVAAILAYFTLSLIRS